MYLKKQTLYNDNLNNFMELVVLVKIDVINIKKF